jgi:hypothetical protein
MKSKTKETFYVAKVSIAFFDRSYRFITATGRFIFQLPLDHNRVYEERIWQLFTAGAVQMEEDHSIFAAGSADHCSYRYHYLFDLLDRFNR